jgi:hypothetical protein
MPDLARWPDRLALRRITALALVTTLAIFIIFAVHDRGLRPYTIIAFELAWTPLQAGVLLSTWGVAGRQVARESLLIDFAYMPAYAFLFAGLVLVEARRSAGRVQRLGLRLALAPFAAWLLDALENAALLGVLAAPAGPPAAMLLVAGLSATLKFLLLLACLLYIVFALAYRLATRQTQRNR